MRPYERYKAYIEEGLEIPAEGLELPVELEPQRTSRLAGWMVDRHGNPIPQFSLWLRNTSVTVPPFVQVTGDQRGYFSVEEVPEGHLRFQTLAVPHLNVSGIALPPDTATEVQLTLDWGKYEANGYVLTAAGDPVPGAQVALLWNDDDRGIHSRSSRRTITDSKGYFLFTQLGPGLHTLTIHAPGFRSAQRDYEVRASGREVLVHLDAQSPPKRSSAVP